MNSPERPCWRCSKPILPGTAAQATGFGPMHLRCLARDSWPEEIEPKGETRREHARAAAPRAEAPVNTDRKGTHCPACRQPFTTSRGVLSQGEQLVHAACWRDDAKPPAGLARAP